MEALLEAKRICKIYAAGRRTVQAVHDVSFSIGIGECLGLVGESGCGKSTIARLITGFERVDAGEILLEGENITAVTGKRRKAVYKKIQMVFQSPADSFNPRITLGGSIMEGLINKGFTSGEARKKTAQYMELCGLSETFAERYPHQVSGGECQRASIARAVAVQPRLLICDEATSALDMTIQAQIMALIGKLRKETGMSFLVVSHDLALVREICDRVLVMREGRIQEEGLSSEIILNPRHEYTKEFIAAALQLSPWD